MPTIQTERLLLRLGKASDAEAVYNNWASDVGQGFATEAARGILQFAKDDLAQTKLFACHAKENVVSGKILKKLGFVYSNDSSYSKFDGSQTFESCDYFLRIEEGTL